LALAGNAEGLARTAAFQNVDIAERFEVSVSDLRDVAEVWDAGFRKARNVRYSTFTISCLRRGNAYFSGIWQILGPTRSTSIVKNVTGERLNFRVSHEIKFGPFLATY